MNEELIKSWIEKKYLYPVGLLFICIGIIFQYYALLTEINAYLISLGIGWVEIQTIHNYVDMDQISKKYPELYSIWYLMNITFIAVILPEYITNHFFT